MSKEKSENTPSWVQNLDKYKDYLEADEKLKDLKESYKEYICSNSKIINVCMPKNKLLQVLEKNKIINPQEVAKILSINKMIYSNQANTNILKRMAKVESGEINNINAKKSVLVERKAEVIEMFGNFNTKVEILENINKEWGVDLKYYDINNFYHNYKKDILRLQDSKMKNWDDLPLSSKRGRLEKYEYLYNKIIKEFNNDKHGVAGKLNFSKELRGILEQVRKEIEGDKIRFDIEGRIDINLTLHSQMQDDNNRLLILQMVLGKVGLRQRINPLYLMYRLQNSWYSKYTGLRRNNDLGADITNYPSSVNYDIDEMHEKFLKKRVDLPDIVDTEIVSEEREVSQKTLDMKNQLLKILSKKL